MLIKHFDFPADIFSLNFEHFPLHFLSYLISMLAWFTAFSSLSIIWKSELPDKIKRYFFPSCSCVRTNVWMHHIDANKTY